MFCLVGCFCFFVAFGGFWMMVFGFSPVWEFWGSCSWECLFCLWCFVLGWGTYIPGILLGGCDLGWIVSSRF